MNNDTPVTKLPNTSMSAYIIRDMYMKIDLWILSQLTHFILLHNIILYTTLS